MIKGKNNLTKYYIQRFTRLRNKYLKVIVKLNRKSIRDYILKKYDNELSEIDETLNYLESNLLKLHYSINNYYKIEKKAKEISPFMIYYMNILNRKNNKKYKSVENTNSYNNVLLNYEKKHNINYLNMFTIDSLLNSNEINNEINNENSNIIDIDDVD